MDGLIEPAEQAIDDKVQILSALDGLQQNAKMAIAEQRDRIGFA